MKFVVDSFGCRSNQAEVQEWIIELEKLGYELTTAPDQAAFGISEHLQRHRKSRKGRAALCRQGLPQHPHPLVHRRLHGQPGPDGPEPEIQELFFF